MIINASLNKMVKTSYIVCIGGSHHKICLEKEIDAAEKIEFLQIAFEDGLRNYDIQKIIDICVTREINISIALIDSNKSEDLNYLVTLQKQCNLQNVLVSASVLGKFNEYDWTKNLNYWVCDEAWREYEKNDDANDFSSIHWQLICPDMDRLSNLVILSQRVVNEILNGKPKDELDTILLFDRWVQKNIQYIKRKVTIVRNSEYVCEEINDERESDYYDVLENHFGVCSDIAFTASLVLNNSALGVKCRCVSDLQHGILPNGAPEGHSWNLIECFGKEYITDFTHNITRNKHRMKDALKTTDYAFDYTLVGYLDAPEHYYVGGCFDKSNLSEYAFDRKELALRIERLAKEGNFETGWGTIGVKKSYKR